MDSPDVAIPVTLWFVSKDRHGNGHRKRVGEVLFIDARTLGRMETRRLRVLDDADIAKIAKIATTPGATTMATTRTSPASATQHPATT